jgi:hypothetical protein
MIVPEVGRSRYVPVARSKSCYKIGRMPRRPSPGSLLPVPLLGLVHDADLLLAVLMKWETEEPVRG